MEVECLSIKALGYFTLGKTKLNPRDRDYLVLGNLVARIGANAPTGAGVLKMEPPIR